MLNTQEFHSLNHFLNVLRSLPGGLGWRCRTGKER